LNCQTTLFLFNFFFSHFFLYADFLSHCLYTEVVLEFAEFCNTYPKSMKTVFQFVIWLCERVFFIKNYHGSHDP
jgi:hypothetical protein